ncbi:MAG: glycosyltransferase [Chitinophagaceae bacterium]|nr:MAG: glycosyltransferase [Chitinophagaceae bacterium]
MYRLLVLKRILENIILFPFILLGRLFALMKPLKKEYNVFFFFPFYHTGGAENVHAQISKATGGSNSIILFTRKSADSRYMIQFQDSKCDIKNISAFTDNKWLYFLNLIFRGIISGYINKQKKKTIVFNGQCNFGYKLSPWVKKNITQVELIHSFNSFSYIRIPFIQFYRKTIMISRKSIEDHRLLYNRYRIPEVYFENITYIQNGISISKYEQIKKEANNKLTVLYSGRGSKEKRIHLFAQIAQVINTQFPEIQFEILGDVSNYLDISNFSFIKFWGNQFDDEKINSIYQNANILLLTSDTEGFPLVIMEAMAASCAIISTPIGDIPLHIRNEENGFLLQSVTNEKLIIEESVSFILRLHREKELLNQIANTNFIYAQAKFGLKDFKTAYRNLFSDLKN